MPGAAAPGAHGAEAWRAALEAGRAELQEAAPHSARMASARRAAHPGPRCPVPGSSAPDGCAVLTLKGPDQRLLGAPGKGALVGVAPAAEPRL